MRNGHLDLTGQKYGKLTVIEELPYRINKNGKKEYGWLCQCECGEYKETYTHLLRTGSTWRCDKCANADGVGIKHHASQTKLYHIWQQMKERCFNPNSRNYYLYGARGITVCDEWKEFSNFQSWALANGYDENANHRTDCSLDRIDNDGDYSPDNCRWVDAKTQLRNRRNTRYHPYHGQLLTIRDISDLENIPVPKLNTQIYVRGYDAETAVTRIRERQLV